MMTTKTWFLYVLECTDGTLYTGITNDVYSRLKAHNSGRGAKYTRGRSPCVLLSSQEVGNKSRALRAEHAFKKLSRQEKMKYVSIGIKIFVDGLLFPEDLNAQKQD